MFTLGQCSVCGGEYVHTRRGWWFVCNAGGHGILCRSLRHGSGKAWKAWMVEQARLKGETAEGRGSSAVCGIPEG